MKQPNDIVKETELIHNLHVGHIYQHYKGNRYKILAIARHTDDLSWMVVYECLYQNSVSQIWVRPLDQFVGTVEGSTLFRFTYIGEK